MAEQTNVSIGDVVLHNNLPMRIVRIIHKSVTLFESQAKGQFTIDEGYLQLKGPNGEIAFKHLYREQKVFEGTESEIRGLEPVPVKEQS